MQAYSSNQVMYTHTRARAEAHSLVLAHVSDRHNTSATCRCHICLHTVVQATGACEHVAIGQPIFAHGMCRDCFEEYLTVSGGICPVSVL